MEMPSNYYLMAERWDDELDEQNRTKPIGVDPETNKPVFWGDSSWLTCGWNPDWPEYDIDDIPF